MPRQRRCAVEARAGGRSRLDARVVLRGQRVQDEVRVLVHAHQVAGLERVGVDEADDGQEDGLPGRRFQHHRLAAAGGVQVHRAAVLLLVRLGREGREEA